MAFTEIAVVSGPAACRSAGSTRATKARTFAGGRIDTTLHRARKVIAGPERPAGDLRLPILRVAFGGEDSVNRVMAVTRLVAIGRPLEQALAVGRLPPACRGSRFQDALPEPWSREMDRGSLDPSSPTDAWMPDAGVGP